MTPLDAQQRKEAERLARVCSCGCGRKLLRADGRPDFSRRRFALKECLGKDKRNRVQSRRTAKSLQPAVQLVVDGKTFRGDRELRLNEAATILRALGHDVSIVRPPRAKKAKA